EGKPENVQVIESTNACFDYSAVSSVKKWRYRPRLVDGEPTVRTGVVTQISFVLAGRAAVRPEIRRAVVFQFRRVERLLKNEDPAKALQVLTEIEEKYGDSFSRAEHSTFLRLRAGVRIALEDYAGALDDLRIVQRMDLVGETAQAVGDMILQLEAVVAENIREPADPSESNGNGADNK
ncbi:MAG: energy transducer TonB, partial [Hyphococcus sp.]